MRLILRYFGYLIVVLALFSVSCSSIILLEPEPTHEKMIAECKADHGESASNAVISGCVEDYLKSLGLADALVYTGYIFGFPVIMFFVSKRVTSRRKRTLE